MSEQFINVYLKSQATARLFHHGSMGDPSKNGDPLTHFHVWFDPSLWRPKMVWESIITQLLLLDLLQIVSLFECSLLSIPSRRRSCTQTCGPSQKVTNAAPSRWTERLDGVFQVELCADELVVGGGVKWSYDRRRRAAHFSSAAAGVRPDERALKQRTC